MTDRLGRKMNLGGLDQEQLGLIRQLRNEWWMRSPRRNVTMRAWSMSVDVAAALADSLRSLDGDAPAQ